MESKKINQLATNVAPLSTDLTIIGDPSTGVSKKVTLSQIAAIFAGAVDFYANLAGFPVTGTINTIYCAKDTQKLYLWSGSAYVETFPSQAVLNTYQLLSAKGVANGYASLDSAGKVPIAQLPSSIMEYKGLWSAATNTPTLANGTGDTGDVYICSAAGSVNFGAGAITFAVGDYVIYSGTIWQRSSGAVGTVTSVGLSSATSGVTIGSSPITTSGTITLAIATATTSQNGLLSLTDWSTFNAKQNAITLTTTGTSGAATFSAGTLNIPQYQGVLTNPITGTGTSGQVAYFNGTSSLTSDATFAFTPTSQLLVNNSVTAASAIARGTNLTPTLTAAANNDVLVGLDINPTFTLGAFTGYTQYGLRIKANLNQLYTTDYVARFENTNASYGNGIEIIGAGDKGATRLLLRAANNDNTNVFRVNGNGTIYVGTGNNNSNGTVIDNNSISLGGYQTIANSGSVGIVFSPFSAANAVTFRQSGNVLIGTTTDAGFRLDVNGTARVQGVTTFLDGLRINGGFTTFNASTIFGAAGQSGNTFNFNTQYVGAATGATNFFNFTGTLQSQTGGSFVFFNMAQTLSNANVAQTYRGIYYNPTVTGLVANTPHIAFENTSGNVLLATTSGNVAIGTSTLGTATELTLGGSQTASSAIARGQLLNTTLVASANSDVLVGLDINPTFTNGAFTGVANRQIRIQNPALTLADMSFGLLTGGGGYNSSFIQDGNGLTIGHNSSSRNFRLQTNATSRIFIAGGGNVVIGSETDAGFRLDVNGTARVQGVLTVTTGGFSVTGNSTLTGDLSMPGYGIDNLSRVNITNAPNGGGLTIRGSLATNTLSINFQESTTSVSQINWDNTNNYLQLRTIKANSVINFTVTGNTISTISSTGVSINGNLITGGTSVNASAQLQVDSTTKGFLPPRMTSAQRTAIASPAEGLIVIQTDGTQGLYLYIGAAWHSITML